MNKQTLNNIYAELSLRSQLSARYRRSRMLKPAGTRDRNTTDCEHVISQQSSGPNTIITLALTVCFHGTFEGTWVGTERDVIHPDGSERVKAAASSAVQLMDGPALRLQLQGQPSPYGVYHWVVDQGTGDLAGLSGQGTAQFVSQDGPGCPTSGFDCEICPPRRARAMTRLPLTITDRSSSLRKWIS